MINKARAKYPSVNINWKIGDAITTDLFAPEQFSCVCFFYFTLYYFPNRRDVFRNCYQWMRPGSVLVLHVVNRDKFDPILDSASPFPAFSLQKYSKSRVTKSGVTFEKFEYNADFDLELKSQDPLSGIRAFEDVNNNMIKNGFELIQDCEMPSHNRLLVYSRLKFVK
jgi:SAM-dependent methyltransferase